MAEYVGNTSPQPQFNGALEFNLNEELLYSTKDGYVQKGVSLKSGQGVLPLGTFLKKDSGTNYYVKADDAADVVGVLRQTTDTGTDAAASAWQANILFGGTLKHAHVSNANSGVTLGDVLNAQVNEVVGFFRF